VGGEVKGEAGAWLDGDEVAVVLPDVFEDGAEQAISFRRVGFLAVEPGEVVEGVGDRLDVYGQSGLVGVELLLEELAAVEVLAAGEVAELVEVFEQ
jgi:hypothetical protein